MGQDEVGQRMEMLELNGKILDAIQACIHFSLPCLSCFVIISPSPTHETCYIHCPKTLSIVDLQALKIIQVDFMMAGRSTNNSGT